MSEVRIGVDEVVFFKEGVEGGDVVRAYNLHKKIGLLMEGWIERGAEVDRG